VAKDDTGDYSDIQTAINALPAGGGRVFIKEGTYAISATITINKSNVVIEGQGDTTILELANNVDDHVFTIGDGATTYSNIVLKNFKIDGNSANQASGMGILLDVSPSNLLLQNLHIVDIKQSGIYNSGSVGPVSVFNCLIESTGQSGIRSGYAEPMDICFNTLVNCGVINYDSIYLVRTRYSRIIGNKVTHDGSSTSAHGIRTQSSNWCQIIGNYISGANQGIREDFLMYDSQMGNVVAGNVVENTYDDGLYCPGREGVCVGNTINSPGSNGITMSGAHCICTGNYIYAPVFYGIEIYTDQYECTNNTIETAQMHGIWIDYGAAGICMGNAIYNAGDSQANAYTAIILTGSGASGSKQNIIADNYLYSDQYPMKTAYGIFESHSACNYNIVHDNICKGYVRQAIATQGLYTKVHDNIVNA
jgi:hypothetical protein